MSRILLIILASATVAHSQSIETIIQKGHELAVVAVAISPDSNYVATASRDKSAKLWELSTGREVRSFLGHQASVIALDFSSDGKYLLTGGNDRTARLWDVKSGKQLLAIALDDTESYNKRYGSGQERINAVAFDPHGKFFVTLGQMVHVWEFPSGKKITSWMVAQGNRGAESLAVSADGQWLAVGTDATVDVYTTKDWKQVHTIKPRAYSSCGGCFADQAFTPDSRYLIKATQKEVVKYDLAQARPVTTFSKSIDDVTAVDASKDGKRILTSTKQLVTLYNDKGDSLFSIDPQLKGEITQARFTNSGKEVLVACDNNIVMIYNAATGKKKSELTGFLNQRDKGGLTYDPNSYWDSYIARYVRYKNNLLLSRDGKSLLKGKFGNKLKSWDIATGKPKIEFTGHEKAALCYQYSADGKKLITGGGDGALILWNAEKGDTIFTIKSYQQPVFDVHFNSDETQILSSSWDGTVKIHDVKTGKRLQYFELKEGSAYVSLFSKNDLYVFTATLGDNTDKLQMREVDSKKIVRTFEGHTDVIASLVQSRDGKKLLSASWDGTIRLWDVATGLAEKKFTGHKGAVHVALLNTTETGIYSAGADRIIRLWDANSGKVLKTFEGHVAEITSLLLTPDEKMLISHSLDGVTKFWDLTTGKEFFEHIHFGDKEWMVKNPEGYFNGTDGARQYIHFVDGLKTYAVDQFFHEFYRPDLLPRIFQSRGNENLKGIQGKLNSAPPPGVKIATLPGDETTQTEVLIRLTDTGSGIESVKLFHNGKSVPIEKSKLTLPSRKGESTTYRHTLTLVNGTNTITASASNKEKIESDPQSVEIVADHGGKSSTCYILSVGINQYKNPKMTLNYAKPDAESFGKVLDEKGSLFKGLELHTLYDADASRANILKKLDELAGKIHQEDVFIFYYAGHGSMVDNQFFFIPTESSRLYDLSALQKEAIEASVLQDKLKNIKALKQLIVMDACQSGASVELLATRGAAEEKAIAQLSRSAGIHVMASAGSEQFATEFAELGHGLFTYLLIKALQGDADGAPKDGKVTIYELKSYLDDQVPEMTQKLKGKPQYPYTFSRGQDFPVVIEKEK
ncbi:MAG: caspase family protein [Cyclobacteriaceae bacterium]|nr:caspase family protein [Cyclobacteriaceae bacterium]